MRVVGIIAEYNPLHKGHIYHLQEALKKSEASFSVVLMSGNFVQRGEPACTDKFTRAKWALDAGVDIVFELPSVFASANAQIFSEGAVRLLNSMRVVTDLAFGCEQASLHVLNELCNILAQEPPAFKKLLQAQMKTGKSYPRARYDALQELGVGPQSLDELVKPNNILAVEYLRSLKKLNSPINPLPIERVGSGYKDFKLTGELSSASAIRKAFTEGNEDVLDCLPLFVSGAVKFDTQFPVSVNDVGSMMLYKIRSMTLRDICSLPEVSEGLEQKIAAAARNAVNSESFFESIKSKRYTMSRIKRIGMNALLGITTELQSNMLDESNMYLRVLGMKKDARVLLSSIAAMSNVPVIIRNSDCEKCSDIAKKSLEIDSFSTDILRFSMQKEIHKDSEAAIIA